jgi:GNAT superfamily N-acetyltransferase
VRKAVMRDIAPILHLINGYAARGIMLPRTEFEMSEAIRDFTVITLDGQLLGCGALHFYSPTVAEIRSLAVHQHAKTHGVGRKLVEALAGQGVAVRVRHHSSADEVWLSSSTKEVLAVTHLDAKPVGTGKPGPATDSGPRSMAAASLRVARAGNRVSDRLRLATERLDPRPEPIHPAERHDLRVALREGRATADTYSPYNSHWTDFGGWIAWRAIVPVSGTPRLNPTAYWFGDVPADWCARSRHMYDKYCSCSGALRWSSRLTRWKPQMSAGSSVMRCRGLLLGRVGGARWRSRRSTGIR